MYILPEDGHRSGPKHVVSKIKSIKIDKIEHKNIVAYGGFKKSISGYTRNRMQNPTIKFGPIDITSIVSTQQQHLQHGL
jgi:hypothetical protein